VHVPISSSPKGLSVEQRSETPELLPSYLAHIARGELLSSREEIELASGPTSRVFHESLTERSGGVTMSVFPANLLLATDGSPDAALAARAAADLSGTTEAKLHVVHVGKSLSAYARPVSMPKEDYSFLSCRTGPALVEHVPGHARVVGVDLFARTPEPPSVELVVEDHADQHLDLLAARLLHDCAALARWLRLRSLPS
jgi:nucleotide-binding universal stress UspA family protein